MTTHKQTWLKVAEAFGEHRGKFGLCFTFAYTQNPSTINNPIYKQLRRFRRNNDEAYWFPLDAEGDSLRCLFACLFATMTKKEFEEVCK